MNQLHVKALELLNKDAINDTSLIGPLAYLLVRQDKSQFRLHDGPDSANWNDYIITERKLQYLTIS